jgi:hypothetical protein
MTFEQSRRLREIESRRMIVALRPFAIKVGAAYSGLIVAGAILRSFSGERVPVGSWLLAMAVGPVATGGLLFSVWALRWQRRWIELRDHELFLSGVGWIGFGKILSWSLLPDRSDPSHTRLVVVRKFGRGRDRWSMLLDDEAQIGALRNVLNGSGIPETPAGPVA